MALNAGFEGSTVQDLPQAVTVGAEPTSNPVPVMVKVVSASPVPEAALVYPVTVGSGAAVNVVLPDVCSTTIP